MPGPYGHQQGGTRRKKNLKGKSKLGCKSRVRRGSNVMRGGGGLELKTSNSESSDFDYNYYVNWFANGGTVTMHANVAFSRTLGGMDMQPLYTAAWDPSELTFTFKFSEVAKLPKYRI